MRKESGIKISDDIVVVYNVDNSTKLKEVCETLNENIVKVIKVPFSVNVPDGYVKHAQSDAEIGEDKEKINLTIFKK